MSRPTPRRTASSRGTTSRPRRLAGQATVRPDAAGETTEAAETADTVDTAETTETTAPVSLDKSPRTPDASPAADPAPSASVRRLTPSERPGILARPKTTRMLIVTLVVVALVLAIQFAILMVDVFRDDPAPESSLGPASVDTTDERPVIADADAVREGVDAAARAALEIVAIDYRKYDDEVAAAADLMTDRFESEYRTTVDGISEQFVANQTQVQANVVAQGVVRVNLTRLQALVFLNQVTSRVRDGEPETVVTPFKVLVTMVHTDQGWLIDGLDTDAPRDKTN